MSSTATPVGGNHLPGKDFRDIEGYPIVGGRCSLSTCGAHDFLPFLCGFCNSIFCQDHAEQRDHDCLAVSVSVGMLASFCKTCGDTVRWDSLKTTEGDALALHNSSCRGLRKVKQRCPVEGCGVTLGLVNSTVCNACSQKVCLTHRFEDAHKCPGKQCTIAEQKSEGAKVLVETISDSGPLATMQEVKELRKALGGTTAAKDACLYAIRRFLQDISADPDNRSLRALSATTQATISNVRGAEDLLKGIGFRPQGPITGPAKPIMILNIPKGRVDAVLRQIT